MKVLIIGRGFATDKRPMHGNFETTQAKALKALGLDIVYASVELRSLRVINQVGFHYHEVDGIKVYNLNTFVPIGRLPSIVKYWIGVWQIKKLFKTILKNEGAPDIIHAHYLKVSSISSVLKRDYNIPFVCTEHWSGVNMEKLAPSVMWLGKKTYNNSDLVIAVSNILSSKIFKHFSVKSKVIYNMVNPAFFNSKADRQTGEAFSFISVGSLKPIKGHTILISAFAKGFRGKNATLKIVGGGPQKGELENLVNELDIKGQVTFTGPKTSDQVQDLLDSSDAFALASTSETFGVVFIEAMAKGLPIVTTKCGGPEEFINSTNGILVDVNDVESFKDALLTLYHNKDYYDRKKISTQCAESFSQTHIATQILSEYEKLLPKNNV